MFEKILGIICLMALTSANEFEKEKEKSKITYISLYLELLEQFTIYFMKSNLVRRAILLIQHRHIQK